MDLLGLRYKIIIPARGGSKRFPKKNIASLNGKPLLQYSIEEAQSIAENFNVSSIVVNTDDKEIAELASRLNVEVYFRDEKLGDDTTSTAEVLKDHVYKSQNDEKFDAVILLQVTNPLRPKNMSFHCLKEFEKSGSPSLCTFSTMNVKFGQIIGEVFHPENYQFGQRMQDLNPRYFENGLFYVSQKSVILDGLVITKDVHPYIVDHLFSNVDIDEEKDLLYAETILQYCQKLKIS